MKELVLAFSPFGNGQSISPFDNVFTHSQDAFAEGFANADAFILWGGTDIHPSFYKDQVSQYSGAPLIPSDRDIWEWKAMQYCKANGIPIIGVCRGAQFLCAFAGGKLIQHCNNHDSGTHLVVDIDGETYPVTSSHHQMLDVQGTKHEMIAWTPKPLSVFYYGEKSKSPAHIEKGLSTGTFCEPEVVFFPEVKGLAIQGHPEWADKNSIFVKKSCEQVVEYLFSGKEWK
ncbi:MAG: gamma-glutamyl-gamma-aminobutyrate hydrolase family protein [Candidatus Magasanikiibacteriota bacterium]